MLTDEPSTSPIGGDELPALDQLRAFVPRLQLHWLDHHLDERWRVLDGSLLYSDVSGFTALSERLAGLGKRGAEETNELINSVMGGMVADCDDEGGEVLVFAGDAVIALFEGPGHTARAARAARAVRTTVTGRHRTGTDVTAMLRVSSGIHSGEILLARTSPGCEKVVMLGPAVTAVCSAEGAATAGDVLLSEDAAADLDERLLGDVVGSGRLLRRNPPQVPEVAGQPWRHDGTDAHLLEAVPPHQRELLRLAPGGEHRVVTVAFIEFSGVDALLATAGPDAVVDALDALSAEVATHAELHHVNLIDTDVAGDGGKYYLAAGAPTSTELDEENLLRMTLAVLAHQGPLRVRAGLNRGRVFAGVIGGSTRRAYTCLGDTVNLAARLCAKAPIGAALVAQPLLDHVRATTEVEPLAPMMVKGKSQPVHTAVVRTIGPRSPAGGEPHATERSTSSVAVPLIGRTAELERLVSLGHRAADTGNGAGVVVTGEAGIGKSRLFDEVIDATGLPYVWVEAEAFQSTTPYAAVRSVLRPLLGIRPGAGEPEVVDRLRALAQLADAPIGRLPLAGLALGVEMASTPEVEEISPNFLRDALHREVLALLAATQPSPLIVVFDDAHLADDASLDLLAALVAFTHRHPWLLCIGHRDDWCPAGAELMALAPLTDADAAQLTDSLVGDVLSAYDRRALEDRGGGNPMFLSELARTARESGSAEDLPESIESLLMARIDQLAVPDRMLLRDASVLGTKFDPAFLASVLDDASIAAPERWVPLEAFVEPDEGAELRFVHALACEAAYEGLPFRRRRTVHGRIGMELEAHPQSAERHAGPMAMHFAAAGDHERGWRYGVLAGDQAKAAFANGDAAVSYARALREAAALPHVDRGAVAAVEERFGDVCDMEGRFDDAATAYRRARRRVGSTRLTRKIGLMHEHLGDYERAIRAQQRAIDELRHATESEEIVERAYALATYAGIRHRQGRLNEALEYGVKAAIEAQRAGDPQALARSTLLLELVTSQLSFVGKSVELFQAAGDLNGEADAHNNRGMAAYYRGDWATSVQEYEAASALFARTGDVVGAATATNNIGEILSDQGRFDEAQRRFADAARGFREANYPGGTSVVVSNIGLALARAGDHERGLEMAAEALEQFLSLDARANVIMQHGRTMESLLLAGRIDAAREVEDVLVALTGADTRDPYTRTTVFRLRGWLALACGDLDLATTFLHLSADEAALGDARYEGALTMVVAGAVDERRTGRPSAATATAWSILDELGVQAVAGWPRPAASE